MQSQVPQLSLHEAIVYFASQGWRFIPLYGKKPFLPDWPNIATNNIETLNWWAGAFKGCNWGVVLGNGIFVLDVDGDLGRATLEQLEREHGKLPLTLTVRTGRKEASFHYYFSYPSDLNIGNCKLGPGLEIKSSGGQCVFPPSIHPDTGNEYSFALSVRPADSPQWLTQRICTAPVSTVVSSHFVFPDPTNFERNYAAKALREDAAKLAAMVHGQQRNHALNSLAFTLATMIAPRWIDRATVEAALLDASDKNGHIAKHGLPQTTATLQSGLRKGLQRPRDPLPLELEPHPGIQVSSSTTIQSGIPLPWVTPSSKSPVKRLSEFKDVPREWWLQDFIPKKQIMGIHGMSGVGKTTFMLYFLCELSLKGNVIFMTNEDSGSDLKLLIALNGFKCNLDNIYIEDSGGDEMPWMLNDFQIIRTLIEKYNPLMIGIDSLTTHVNPKNVSISNAPEMAQQLIPLRKLATDFCTIALICHDNKSNSSDPARKAGNSHAIVSTLRHNIRISESQDTPGVQLVTVFQTNTGSMKVKALQFTMEPFTPLEERLDITASEAITKEEDTHVIGKGFEKDFKRKIAINWIKDQMKRPGPKLAKEIKALALEQSAINPRTLDRAREELDIESVPNGDGIYEWRYKK